MKKDISYTLKRAQYFNVILIGEGLLVGSIAGLVVLAYRIALKYAGQWSDAIREYIGHSPMKIIGWFGILVLMAIVVGLLIKWEPMISGSGIPQLEGEMVGKLNQTWWKVLPSKFIGGFLSLLAGLSLGREGPSIQLGAMTGKGISKMLDRGKTEEKFLLTCGASAGLSAAFHAPLAGVMFSLEEVHKNFSVSVLVSVMTASISADYLSSQVMGIEPVFQFKIGHALPQNYYWLIIVLGVVLGVLGCVYNWFTLKMQSWYKQAKYLNEITKVMIPFIMAGFLMLVMPELLGSGHKLIDCLTNHELLLGGAIIILVGKFLFSVISFGSGAPGGIFFPLLVLGAFVGGIFGMVCVNYFGMDSEYINNFVLLAMAGNFTAIVRAPLTGIILIFEMTGSVSQMLSLSVVSIVAYVVASLLGSEPIYESLLHRLLKNKEENADVIKGQKMLVSHVIMHGSPLAHKMVQEIEWPINCLLVSIKRGDKEVIPKGKTVLLPSDMIVTLVDEKDEPYVREFIEKLCIMR
ncbi:ClC family H(+)/Cl(-) exchange transporter [Faecalimonas sp.]